MENEQRIDAQEIAREMTHQRQQMSAQLFGLAQENEVLQKQVQGLEERLAQEQADKQAQVSSVAGFQLRVACIASRLLLVSKSKPAMNDRQLDVIAILNMRWQRRRLMHNVTGLGGPNQRTVQRVSCAILLNTHCHAVTWAYDMLQVFVAGFVSKMMERIIAEQRVAAEHQRQIRDLQYVSQTVISPKH